jgi:hypothetical protein
VATTTVQPGELKAAIAAAAPGDTLDVFGLQDLGGRYTNSKHVTLTNGAGQRATILGALIDAGGLWLDGGTDPFNGFLLDDNTPLDSVGRPSWIIDFPSVQWRGVELTNRHSKIGLQPNDYGAGGAGFQLSYAYIHGIGRLYTTQADAGAQAQQRSDGTWSDNHEHGYYGSGSISGLKIADTLIEDCADRGLQFRSGVSGATVQRVLVRKCGMGFMWGDPCSNVALLDSILLDCMCPGRALFEEYNTGSGNSASNVVLFRHDGGKVDATTSIAKTNVRTADPQYDPTARKLGATSPALGLGPAFVQPGATPTPTPTPTVDIPNAVLELKKTTADGVDMVKRYGDDVTKWPTSGHWYNALRYLGVR